MRAGNRKCQIKRIKGTDLEYESEPCRVGEEHIVGARICATCGEAKAIQDFKLNGNEWYGYECKACLSVRMKDAYNEGRKRNTYEYWEKRLYVIERNDKKLGRSFDITPGYIMDLWMKQRGRCAYTGLKGETLSIDRIDNNRGHVVGNVVLVDTRLNVMRGAMPQDMFIDLCCQVAKHCRGKK